VKSSRSSWQVTRSVWHALFLREMIGRTTSDRFAWLWMVIEPVALIAMMVSVRVFLLGGAKTIVGADFVPWLVTGLMAFFLFRENMNRSIGAIDSNKGLFTYRQVQTIDPVLVRCFLEGSIKTFILVLFILILELLGTQILPDNYLRAMLLWFSLWLLGLGVGLVLSVAANLIPEIGRLVKMISLPLMILSGVILPLNYLPIHIREYVLLNPIVHGIELLREAFFSTYQPVSGVSITYLGTWVLITNTLGLILHLKFSEKLKST